MPVRKPTPAEREQEDEERCDCCANGCACGDCEACKSDLVAIRRQKKR